MAALGKEVKPTAMDFCGLHYAVCKLLAFGKISDRVLRVCDGSAQLSFARLVPVNDGGSEFAGLRIDILKEPATLRGSVELVGGHETDTDPNDEPKKFFHCSAPSRVCGFAIKPSL